MDRIAPWLQTNWDHRAAGNFIGGGTGSGLAIFAAASELAGGNPPRAAYVLAALFIVAGLSLVWLEIGRPWRFLHVFFNPQTSWMTREALIAPPLLIALAAAAWHGGAALAAVAALLALAFVYCQARMLRGSMGIPAWREPLIVPLALATGLAEGAGVLLALAIVAGAAPSRFVLILALLSLVARWIAWAAYCRHLARRGAPTATRQALQAIDLQVLVLGTIAPIALIAAALGFADYAGPIALAAGVLGLAAGWLIKDTILTRAAFNQGFAVPHLARLGAVGSDSSTRPGWS
ncbi:MAG TPA: NrfD/PsrC family molybdoenzyme membrane anchor subunit [Stellaceae bacterium]|nr:NrfD/PsrC family molybdoenzyme membrane anchor subunit [Stellaceae bacterium]